MSKAKEEFIKKLHEFFDRHDPDKKDLAPRIAARFMNHQDEVFEHLSELYHEKEGIEVTDDEIFNAPFGPNEGYTPY
ncbi:MAG: hypothetical protein Kow0075_06530 [Salibacteraceae bacterium]